VKIIFVCCEKTQVIREKLTRRATALAVPVLWLSWFISNHFTQFTLYVRLAAKNRQSTLKLPIWGFKVIEGHRCWHQ